MPIAIADHTPGVASAFTFELGERMNPWSPATAAVLPSPSAFPPSAVVPFPLPSVAAASNLCSFVRSCPPVAA
jgi:hypothetical protein